MGQTYDSRILTHSKEPSAVIWVMAYHFPDKVTKGWLPSWQLLSIARSDRAILHFVDALWGDPHGKDLRPPDNGNLRNWILPTTTWVSEEADPSQSRLDMNATLWETLRKKTQLPYPPQKKCEIINVCYFRSLHIGIMCYVAQGYNHQVVNKVTEVTSHHTCHLLRVRSPLSREGDYTKT